MLPLTFADKADYDKVKPDDLVTLNDLVNLAPGRVRVFVDFFYSQFKREPFFSKTETDSRNETGFLKHCDNITYDYAD